jgi:hypothetical protein
MFNTNCSLQAWTHNIIKAYDTLILQRTHRAETTYSLELCHKRSHKSSAVAIQKKIKMYQVSPLTITIHAFETQGNEKYILSL